MTLNDLTFDECASALAKLMLEVKGCAADQISYGFTRVTCRVPNADELQRLEELHQAFEDEGNDEQVAMTSVARVLLNLDEVLTK